MKKLVAVILILVVAVGMTYVFTRPISPELGDVAVEESDDVPLGSLPTDPAAQPVEKNYDVERAQAILELVNAERAKAGLGALTLVDEMCTGATIRATEQKTAFSHTRPDGRNCFSIFADLQIAATYRGENLAYGGAKVSAQKIMDLWMSSEGHKANILNERFTRLGVGFYESGKYGYWCQLFAE